VSRYRRVGRIVGHCGVLASAADEPRSDHDDHYDQDHCEREQSCHVHAPTLWESANKPIATSDHPRREADDPRAPRNALAMKTRPGRNLGMRADRRVMPRRLRYYPYSDSSAVSATVACPGSVPDGSIPASPRRPARPGRPGDLRWAPTCRPAPQFRTSSYASSGDGKPIPWAISDRAAATSPIAIPSRKRWRSSSSSAGSLPA
jgi:hypothetical protein